MKTHPSHKNTHFSKMANQRGFYVVMIITAWFLYSATNIHGWGKEGHTIICKIAQVFFYTHLLRFSVYNQNM